MESQVFLTKKNKDNNKNKINYKPLNFKTMGFLKSPILYALIGAFLAVMGLYFLSQRISNPTPASINGIIRYGLVIIFFIL